MPITGNRTGVTTPEGHKGQEIVKNHEKPDRSRHIEVIVIAILSTNFGRSIFTERLPFSR